jgi:hypothetical protein
MTDKLKMTDTNSISRRISCSQCKWFIPNKTNHKDEYGLCKIFQHSYPTKDKPQTIYEYADHCRKNEFQCGESGYFFEPSQLMSLSNKLLYHDALKNENVKNEFNDLNKLQEQMNDLIELNCGEVNEKDDLEFWEKEIEHIKKIMDRLQSKNKI